MGSSLPCQEESQHLWIKATGNMQTPLPSKARTPLAQARGVTTLSDKSYPSGASLLRSQAPQRSFSPDLIMVEVLATERCWQKQTPRHLLLAPANSRTPVPETTSLCFWPHSLLWINGKIETWASQGWEHAAWLQVELVSWNGLSSSGVNNDLC